MFCLMDVSGSMTEAMKDLAKRFFMLLHVFLTRRYQHVDIVFIRHTSTRRGSRRGDVLPQPRDRRHGRLDRARGDAGDRARALPTDRWNIYAAQASDGDNYTADSDRCMPAAGRRGAAACQYFAYIEVGAEGTQRHGFASPPTDLWRAYSQIAPAHRNFAMRGSPIRRRSSRCSTSFREERENA